MAQEPMIKLEPNGTAPILSYNVPEPTSYSGRHLVELETPDDWFTAAAREVIPEETPETPPGGGGGRPRPPIVVIDDLVRATAAALDPTVGGSTLPPGTMARVVGTEQPVRTVAAKRMAVQIKNADEDDTNIKLNQGYRLARYTDMYGQPAARVLPKLAAAPRPRILLIEVYRLSSYLGAYGAGRVLKTFTLLPGEKTKVSVKTYTKRTEDRKEASSILDSFTKESADDFEKSMASEQSDKQNSTENFEYHAEAEASASWGWGSAKVSGGVKGGTTSAREEFAKNTSNATQKHSAKASAKREVSVNTSYEVKEESGEETSIERTIENVNLSRTLNYIFRQMNQQFVTILHLVDARLAFYNGSGGVRLEVALPEMQKLLDRFVDPAHHAELEAAVRNQLSTVRDHAGDERPFVEDVVLGPNDGYLRVKKEMKYSYTEPVTQQRVEFTGIPMAVDKYTMRTEGVIVEALLGQADALDQYARDLQELEVRRRTAEVEKMEADAAKAKLVNTLAESGTEAGAKMVESLLCPCGPTPIVAPAPAPAPH
jgi:hypothetical protein